MFNFAAIPTVSDATLREMACMFAFGNSFETLGKHFHLDPDQCRMIAVDNWDKWNHYSDHAHELYRREQTLLLVTQALAMLQQTTEPKGFTALLRVVLNFFRIPFGRKAKAAPKPSVPPTPVTPPNHDADEYDDDDDDDDWDIPDHIVAETRTLVAQLEAERAARIATTSDGNNMPTDEAATRTPLPPEPVPAAKGVPVANIPTGSTTPAAPSLAGRMTTFLRRCRALFFGLVLSRPPDT